MDALGMQVAQIERKGYAGFRDFDVAGKQIRLAADAVGQQRAVFAVSSSTLTAALRAMPAENSSFLAAR